MGKKNRKKRADPTPPLPEWEPPALYSKRKYIWTIDFIAMRIEVPGKCFEDKEKIKIKLGFYKKSRPIITGERINVASFYGLEPLKQFKTQPEKLAAKLLYKGIKLKLTYGKEKIGNGLFTITEPIAAKVLNMVPPSVLYQTSDVMLTKKAKTTGLLTLQFRLEQMCIPIKPDTGKKKKKKKGKGKKKGKKGKKGKK